MHFELLIIFLVSFVDSQTTERNDVLCVNKQCKLRYREWVIKCAGGILNARFVADFMGLQFLFPLAGFSDTYVMRAKVPTTHTNWNRLIRVPRSSTIQWMQEQVPLIRTKRKAPTKVEWNDPLYPEMWYLTRSSEGKGHDMKVQEAWKLGYTGKNVVVTIMDDGVDHTHPDLITNYDPDASFDVIENDSDPMPDLKNSENNKHGTRCAGQIAAQGNNSVCIVGIAYNARIGGIRMLDGSITDRIEAQTLSFRRDHIDIYSGSWGPEDTGKVYEGPGVLAQSAFQRGVITGRNGLGNIYVWASGNGGSSGDSCAADGYASSPFTLSVSGVGEHNRRPWYLEQCASTLATTYSSGALSEKTIATVDTNHKCTTQHTGTSASAPMAAGIIALLLEANPRLSWRDVQYVTLLSANPEPFMDGNFTKNAVGRAYSLLYGYGLMDAEKMVRLGELWRGVPAHHHCTSKVGSVKRRLNGTFSYVFNLTFHGCQRDEQVNSSSPLSTSTFSGSGSGASGNVSETGDPVRFLEHVQVYADIYYYRRGLLQLTVISPSGTESIILPPRINDDHSGNIGLSRWPLTTVQFWGETADGVWQFRLDNVAGHSRFQSWQRPVLDNVEANWVSVWMVAYGTDEFPIRLKPPNPARPPPPEWFNDFSKYVVDDSKWHSVYTCHVECAPGGCTGPAADQCLGGCRHFATQSRQCVAKCPPGTTPFGALRVSITQHGLWEVHKRGRGRSKSDGSGSAMSAYDTVLSSRIRISDAQDHMHGVANNVVCQPCWSLCAACVRPYTEYDCTACSNGRYLVPLITPEESATTNGAESNLLLLSISDVQLPVIAGTCRTECPPGYYPNKTSSVCNQCIPHCVECVGPRIGECILCKAGFRLVHGRCVDGNSIDGRCQSGKYLKMSRCIPCESSCEPVGCLANGHCILCKTQFPYFMNGSCVSECPPGWFPGFSELSPYAIAPGASPPVSRHPQRCERCGPGCQNCTGFYKCVHCAPGLDLHSGRCVLSRPNTMMPVQKCAAYYRSPSDCLTCPVGKHLLALNLGSDTAAADLTNVVRMSALSSSDSRRFSSPPFFNCVQSCPQGTFLTNLAQGETVCRPCPTACSACSDETHCTACSTPFYLDRVTNLCLFGQPCRQTEYFDQQQQTCVPCDPTCGSCRGPLTSDCTSCLIHGPAPRCLHPVVSAESGNVTVSPRSNEQSSDTGSVWGRCVACCAYKFALISRSPRDCMFCVADKSSPRCLNLSDSISDLPNTTISVPYLVPALVNSTIMTVTAATTTTATTFSTNDVSSTSADSTRVQPSVTQSTAPFTTRPTSPICLSTVGSTANLVPGKTNLHQLRLVSDCTLNRTCLSGSDISAGEGLLVDELDASRGTEMSWFSRETRLVLLAICLVLLLGSLVLTVSFMVSTRNRHRRRRPGSTIPALQREHRIRQSGRTDRYQSGPLHYVREENDDANFPNDIDDEDESVRVSLKPRLDPEGSAPSENGSIFKHNAVSIGEFHESSNTILPLHSSNGNIGNGFTSANHFNMMHAFSPFDANSRRAAPTTDPYQRVRYSQLRSTPHDEDGEDGDPPQYEEDYDQESTAQDDEVMPACTIHAVHDGEFCSREPPPPRPLRRDGQRLPTSSPGLNKHRS